MMCTHTHQLGVLRLEKGSFVILRVYSVLHAYRV